MTKDKLNKGVREWYTIQYPTDELGVFLNPDLTFKGVFDALVNGENIYEVFMVGDSIIRERVFDKLASLMDTPYESIYDLWLS